MKHAPRDPWLHQVLGRVDHPEHLQCRLGDDGVMVRDAEHAADVGVDQAPSDRPRSFYARVAEVGAGRHRPGAAGDLPGPPEEPPSDTLQTVLVKDSREGQRLGEGDTHSLGVDRVQEQAASPVTT